ncbi:MAG: RHS repeat protein [Candidatus Thiodiazotropha lotti]|nr:RHS repeat protein [Candidatus Thiodiazotropha lotti]MCW4221499.1 RHS repeat protein [Candidatus Thiodiazotropha lotti]
MTSNNAGWSFKASDGSTEKYDSDGKLISKTSTTHQTTLYHYGDDGRLGSVTGHYGDTLTYHYDEAGFLTTITTPDGDLEYDYDAEGRLVSVTYPDNNTRQYHYEDPDFPYHLTGITDDNGDRYATWAYDAEGRAILSEHAGNAERVEFAYNPDGTTTVTDAAGAERIYHFTVQQGQMKVDHIEGDRCTTCSGGDNQAYTYDSNGFIASKTDWNGNTTTYTRDSQGREQSRTEASGTPQARTITTTWDTTLNKPLTVTDPEQITQYTYDTEGRLLSRQQSPIQ